MLPDASNTSQLPDLRQVEMTHDRSLLNEAIREYRYFLRDNPDAETARLGLAIALYRNTDYMAAKDLLQDLIEAFPELAQAYFYLGMIYKQLGDIETAKDNLEMAVFYTPDNAQGWQELVYAHKMLDNLDRAHECCERLCELKPEDAASHFLRGLLLHSEKNFEEAEKAYKRTVDLDPENGEALNNLGHVLLNLEHFEEAVVVLEKAVELRPQMLEAMMNLGTAYSDIGRTEEALTMYDRVLVREPNNFETRWYRSNTLLAERRYEEGWQDYEYRFHSGVVTFRPLPYPMWEGTELSDKILLIYAEQGLGDEIMFASCIPEMLQRSRHCVIECNDRLETLFRRSFPEATVFGCKHEYAPPWLTQAPHIDVQIPTGSLPLYLRRQETDFPQHQGYLKADPERVGYWRQRLAGLGDGLKVGISWRGGTAKTRIRSRSIPLMEWSQFLQLDNVQFVSLQYGDVVDEIKTVESQYHIDLPHWQEAIDDYDETAALVSSLDLVISVCTAVIHLSGALGKDVWILTPRTPEWRYTNFGDSLPWYPSSRLFRQPRIGDWPAVFDTVLKALQDRLASTL